MKQVCSLRGTLASTTFGEKTSDILKWKRKPEVATCYKDLFEKMDNNEDSLLTLTQILANFFN